MPKELPVRRRNRLDRFTKFFLRVVGVHLDRPQAIVSDVAKVQGELDHVSLIYVEFDCRIPVGCEHPHAV